MIRVLLPNRYSLSALLLSTLICTGIAKSDTLIDQQSTTANSIIGPGSGQGQSFTPTLASIDFATFSLAVPSASRLVFADLLSGDGFGGTLLGISDLVLITGSTPQSYEFDFSPGISLTPGQIYTLGLNDGFGDLYAVEGTPNPYAGGSEYDSSQVAQPNYDLVFSEGINAVPEPGTISLIAMGLLGVLGIRRRKTVL